MIYIVLNLVPITAATLAGLAIGYAAHRLGAGEQRLGWGMAALVAAGEFWLAAILAGALILAPPRADPWVMTVASAVVIWAGFVAPTVAISFVHQRASSRRAAGAVLHWLAVMVTQAVVMKAIGLIAPPPGN